MHICTEYSAPSDLKPSPLILRSLNCQLVKVISQMTYLPQRLGMVQSMEATCPLPKLAEARGFC